MVPDLGFLGESDEGVPLEGTGQSWWGGGEEFADGVAAGVGWVFVGLVFEPGD